MLVENQRELALEVDNAFHDISRLEKHILGVAYQEGEKTVKCFKKSTGWASMPESEIKRMFKDHLTDLGVTSNPAVEVIKPRSGKSSFLKITFMTGEKKGI